MTMTKKLKTIANAFILGVTITWIALMLLPATWSFPILLIPNVILGGIAFAIFAWLKKNIMRTR